MAVGGLVLHIAAEKCHWLWTDCGRDGVEQERYRVEREEGDFKQCFPTKNYYATTRTTTTSHKPPCSTRPPLCTQPITFDNFTGRQGASTPYLQQPTTTFHETATHMRISTHFTQVSRASSHRLLSFHTVQTLSLIHI